MADKNKRKLKIIEGQVGRWVIWETAQRALYVQCTYIVRTAGTMYVQCTHIVRTVPAGRVASLEPKGWARQAWNMAEEKRLPWANKINH